MWNPLGAGDSNLVIHTTMNDFGALVERLEDDDVTGSDWTPVQEMTFFRLFYHIDIQSIIDFVDTDGKVIVSAGIDPEIKVWSMEDGKFIRQLTGHSASVTGLKILGQGLKELSDSTVLSSSKDGTIRQWSLRQGQEVRRITTPHPLTCMGIPNPTLVAAGNIKGCLEVYHLVTGKRFTTVVAHTKAIDALVVDGNYICTAVYGPPSSSLNVWMLKWGKLICTYRLEEQFPIEFSTFTFLNENILVIGESNQQVLHAINIATDEKQSKEINRTEGHVQHVEALLDILLVSTINLDGVVQLHLYLQEGFDHLATFYCKGMERISSMRMVKEEGSMKFILGGSSLAILQLGDSENNGCLDELKYRCRQAQKMALETNSMSEYLFESEAEQNLENSSHREDECSETPLSGTLKSDFNSTEEKLKHLSLLNETDPCKYPTERGIVKLPPIEKEKSEILAANSKMTSLEDKPNGSLELDTSNKLDTVSKSEDIDTDGYKRMLLENHNHIGNQDRPSIAVLEVTQTENSGMIGHDSLYVDDGFILNPLSYDNDDEISEITNVEGSLKSKAKKKQKNDVTKIDCNVKKRCSIM